MPAMLRSKKAQKIMWEILPKPFNLTEKKSKQQEAIDKQLLQQWTQRQR